MRQETVSKVERHMKLIEEHEGSVRISKTLTISLRKISDIRISGKPMNKIANLTLTETICKLYRAIIYVLYPTLFDKTNASVRRWTNIVEMLGPIAILIFYEKSLMIDLDGNACYELQTWWEKNKETTMVYKLVKPWENLLTAILEGKWRHFKKYVRELDTGSVARDDEEGSG
ncbi:TPA_asm: hypothetical protein [Powellomyces chytrid fungus MELD virus 4]|nr:TPA_asm: hypothetical protein [Powellomyces chytrid fungus MELD virus 4]